MTSVSDLINDALAVAGETHLYDDPDLSLRIGRVRNPKPLPPWRRSYRGNLTCAYEGFRITIFERPVGSGRYVWCISDGEKVVFPEGEFGAEETAMDVIGELVKGGLLLEVFFTPRSLSRR